MKKLCAFLMVFCLFASIFALDITKVNNEYLKYIKIYTSNDANDEAGKAIKNEIRDIGLYRFYRNNMVGSAEYNDRPTDIQTYLSKVKEKMTFESVEQELAFAGFLCYVQSDISGVKLSEEVIRSMPAFFLTVDSYSQKLKDSGYTYLGNVIAYSLGLVEATPYDKIEKIPLTAPATLENVANYTYNGQPDNLYDEIIATSAASITHDVKILSTKGLSGADLETEIDNISTQYLGSEIAKIIEKEAVKPAINLFVKEAPEKSDLGNLRLIAYVALLLLGYFFAKKYIPYLIGLIFIGEFAYFIFAYDFTRDIITSFIYGSFIIISVLILLIVKLFAGIFKKEIKLSQRLVSIAILCFIGVLFMLPYVNSKDLLMDKNQTFYNSQFKNQLLNDVVNLPSAMVYRNLDTGNVEGMKTTLEGIIKYSNEDFKKLVKESALNLITSKNRQEEFKEAEITKAIDEKKSVSELPLNVYMTSFGTKIIIMFMLGILIYTLSHNKVLQWITLGGMVLSSVLAFIKIPMIDVIGELKYPVISTSDYSVNILYGIAMLATTALFYISKKGGSEG